MSHPFKVDFLFKLSQFTVGCCFSQVAWKYVLAFLFLFLRSSLILKYVEVAFLLKKKLMSSSIFDNNAFLHFQKNYVLFHFPEKIRSSAIFQKKLGRLPFSKKFRSSSIFRKIEVIFHLKKKLRSSSI